MTAIDDLATAIPPHVPADRVVDFDFYDMGAEIDVHRFYRALHDRPDVPDVFWTPRNGGHWVLTRYADMVAAFEDRETFSSRQQLIPAPPEGLLGLVTLDGEEHAAFRKLVQPSLTTPFVEGNPEGERLDSYIARVCNDLIDAMYLKGGCEFHSEFSTRMPIEVVMKTLVDLPEEDLPRLMPLVDAVAHAGSDPEEFGAAFFGLAMYMAAEVIPKRRANPGSDMLSAIVHGTVLGRPLTDEEIIATCNVMIIGGLDTVTSMLLYTVWHLAEHPEDRRRLARDHALIPKAVEELLRRYAILNVCRYVARDTEFNGVHFAEGDLVLLPSTAAAIDETRYPDSFTVDFDRPDKKHLSFSRGPHSCVGSLLARREMRIFIVEWLRRIPEFGVKPGTRVEMQAAIANRIKELHLVWDVRAAAPAAVAEPGPSPLLTPDQLDLDTRALELLEHPEVVAARAEGVERLTASLQYGVADGPATLEEAVDNVLFGSLQAAVNNDPTRPRVVWSERLPYQVGELAVPGARYGGDTSDRIYRGIGVSPGHRYEITGRRHPSHPTEGDFSVEAIPPPAMWGSALNAVQAPRDIDLADDGSWTVIADATPTDGRRNHLHLPPETVSLLVRDTVRDWAGQVPSEVSVRVLDAEPGPERSCDEIAADGAATFRHCVEWTTTLFENALRPQPVNTLTAFYRPVGFGVPGGVLAFNRFELAADEALLLTLDPIGAGYLGVVASSPWMCSVAYDRRLSSLDDAQAQPDGAGTYTFLLGPTDPGVHNWIDTGGLRTGLLLARWERFETPPLVQRGATEAKLWAPDNRVPAAVADVRVVKLAEVAAAVPAGQSSLTPEERAAQVARRVAEYRVRLTGRPLGDPR